MTHKTLFRLACALLVMAVISGAFGAHLLKNLLNPAQLQAWHTAVLYQFIHALGMLFLSGKADSPNFQPNRIKVAGYLLFLGVLFFSGSLYLLTTQELMGIQLSFLGPITPVGGLLFIAGWLVAFFSLKKSDSNEH